MTTRLTLQERRWSLTDFERALPCALGKAVLPPAADYCTNSGGQAGSRPSPTLPSSDFSLKPIAQASGRRCKTVGIAELGQLFNDAANGGLHRVQRERQAAVVIL